MNISSKGTVAHNQAQWQPGTHSIPPGLDAFIIRLPNPIYGYNDKIRVQNEAAALSIARDALQAKFPDFVPRVFGWEAQNMAEVGFYKNTWQEGHFLTISTR